MVAGRYRGCAVIVHGPRGARASQLIAGVRQTWGEAPRGSAASTRGAREADGPLGWQRQLRPGRTGKPGTGHAPTRPHALQFFAPPTFLGERQGRASLQPRRAPEPDPVLASLGSG